MAGIKYIVHEAAPLWYDLSFSNLTIRVHIQSDVFKAIQLLLVNPDYTLDHGKHYLNHPQVGAWQTIPDQPGSFGYGGVGSYTQAKDGVVTCSFPLPRVDNPINEAASLEALFDLVWILEILKKGDEQPSQTSINQLVVVDIMSINVDGRSHMAGLQVLFSAEMLNWIMDGKCTGNTRKLVIASMQDAYIHMSQAFYDKATARSLAEDDCNFEANDRRPWFGVPGNACDLAPEGDDSVDPSEGCKLGPHNVDGHIQQLTLLVGVAKLCELARKSVSQGRAP